MLTNRIGSKLGSIVDLSQTTSIPGQHIQYHVLLAYALIKGYSAKGGPPRCMIQMELQKAYDSVEWQALDVILAEIGFPNICIGWIMTMVRTVSYRYRVNHNIIESIVAKQGLRHGHHLSPLLFIIVMEYLHRVLSKMGRHPDFSFHDKCESLRIIYLSFADDLLVFSRGDKSFVKLTMKVMENFAQATGLQVNPSKCNAYFGNVDTETKKEILNTTGFVEGSLPFRYLGIPSSSRKITVNNSLVLVDKIASRIRH